MKTITITQNSNQPISQADAWVILDNMSTQHHIELGKLAQLHLKIESELQDRVNMYKNSLVDLYNDLGTLKWIGSDEGWDLAIQAVQKEIKKRINNEN